MRRFPVPSLALLGFVGALVACSEDTASGPTPDREAGAVDARAREDVTAIDANEIADGAPPDRNADDASPPDGNDARSDVRSDATSDTPASSGDGREGGSDTPGRDTSNPDADAPGSSSDVTPDAIVDPGDGGNLDEILHLNDLQMEGTHNSYHIETTGGIIPAWAYTHKPLDVQLETEGVRQFELDFHYNGPGDFPVHHVPPDVGSTCASLGACLTLMKTWSDAHPRHPALVVLLEQKDELDIVKISGHYDEVDAALLAIWPKDRIITPDEVRGTHATLREAVTTDGWPTLGKSRGRILFAFIGDSTEYMMGHPNLENRVVFPRATVSDAFAAFVLLDNAQSSEAQITDAVKQGFIVRTRYNGEELKLVPAVIDAAQRGGAQCLSGDFPRDFAIPGGSPSRCNPVRVPAGCPAGSIE